MTATRYTPRELRSMTLRELNVAGSELGLTFGKNHNRAERSRRILAAYATMDLTPPDDTTPASPSQPPADLHASKPDFEALLTGEPDATVPTSTGRGGARAGAGRPPGMTTEIAAYNRLSEQPHPAIKAAICQLFDAWAARADCSAVKLTKDEAVDLALPWTQAYELSPLNGRIPPWLSVAVMCLWSTSSIITAKAALAREAAERRRAVQAAKATPEN